MRVYFLSEQPSNLFVDGIFVGTVDGFERTFELNPSDGHFCELKTADMVPLNFVFDEKFLISPPPQIKLYFRDGAVAVYAYNFLLADPSMKVLFQTRLLGARLTLFLQGKLQLEFSDGQNLILHDLPFFLSDSKPCAVGHEILLEGERGFALFSEKGKLVAQNEGRILEKTPAVKAEIPFHDSVGHTAVCCWENGQLKDCAIRSLRQPTEETFALAFFESVLIGADPSYYLADSLLAKADSLHEFLGDFVSVVLTGEQNRVGLVYPRGERIFDVRPFVIETEDGKIKNIIGG